MRRYSSRQTTESDDSRGNGHEKATRGPLLELGTAIDRAIFSQPKQVH